MRRGSTQTLTLNTGIDCTNLDKLDVSFAQRNKVILSKTLSDCTVDGTNIIVYLSEEDTLKFSSKNNPVQIQMRFGIGNERFASGIKYINIEGVLKDGVL